MKKSAYSKTPRTDVDIAVRKRLEALEAEGFEPILDPETIFFFIEINEMKWPEDLNPGWKVLHAPEVYSRLASDWGVEVDKKVLDVLSIDRFGDILLIPESCRIPMRIVLQP